jgi:hypothetical protein
MYALSIKSFLHHFSITAKSIVISIVANLVVHSEFYTLWFYQGKYSQLI